jgi:RNA polymerase sigma-70 factor (ECF subfamily)
MVIRSMRSVIQQLCKSLTSHQDEALTDAQLLRQFIEHGDEAAFATIVRRHGTMVMGVCLRVIQNEHDAEDAFQATFLVLVRKAASIARRELLANWLYGVAHHTALKARAATMKRRAREKQIKDIPEPSRAAPDLWSDELQVFLDQELSRLPEKYRVPIILCDLEGKTRKEAARLLGCPEGSLSSRLARARAMLAKRLARHGLAVSGASLAAVLAQQGALACVPPLVVSAAVKSAALVAAGQTAAKGISPQVAALTEGVLKAMLLTKLKPSMLALGAGLVAILGVWSAYHAVARQPLDGNTIVQRQTPATAGKSSQRAEGSATAVKRELETLQGRWQLVACTEDGHDAPRDLVQRVQIDFQGDKMKFTPPLEFQEKQVVGETQKRVAFKLGEGDFDMTFQLDPTRKPKGIDLTLPVDIEKRQVVKGIYALAGDRLTICLRVGDRPSDFTSAPGSNQLLYVMKRKGPVAGPSGKPVSGDQKAIQGAWKVVSAQRYGLIWKNVNGDFVMQDKQPMAFPLAPEYPVLVIFSGQSCRSEFPQGPGQTLVERDTFTLDPSRNPKWITLTAADGNMVYGIYSLERDELRLCWQYGPRRALRPTDFQTAGKFEKDRDDDPEVWVLQRPAPDGNRKPAPKDESTAVPIRQAWDGIIRNRQLLKESPPEGFVVEAEAWANMWKGWRAGEALPAIDFNKQMAIVLTVPGPNRIAEPELRIDRSGNVKVPLPVSTLLPDDGRVGYRILIIDRAGVKSVNGRSILKPSQPSY